MQRIPIATGKLLWTNCRSSRQLGVGPTTLWHGMWSGCRSVAIVGLERVRGHLGSVTKGVVLVRWECGVCGCRYHTVHTEVIRLAGVKGRSCQKCQIAKTLIRQQDPSSDTLMNSGKKIAKMTPRYSHRQGYITCTCVKPIYAGRDLEALRVRECKNIELGIIPYVAL